MILQKINKNNSQCDVKCIVNVTSKSISTIQDIFGVSKTIAQDIKYDSTMNNYVLITTRFQTPLFTMIKIDDIYMDSKMFANGHPKVTSEFRILFGNLFEKLSLEDILVICGMARNSNPKPTIQGILKLYNETPYKSRELYNILTDTSGYNFDYTNNSRAIKTHLYDTYNGFDEIISRYDAQVIFPLTKIVRCDYTDNIFQIDIKSISDDFVVCTDNYGYVERDYYEDYFRFCDDCDEQMHCDDLYYNEDEDESYCDRCQERHDERELRNAIHSYSFKPTPKFYSLNPIKNIVNFDMKPINKEKLYFGLELEIEARNSSVNLYEDANNINQLYDGLFYCKSDSSIASDNDGFEIVSHPITFNAIKNLDLNETLCKYRDEYKSFYSRNCGMHIHLSRSAFNDIQLYKFVLMMNQYQTLVHLVSQRRRLSEYDSWCAFNNNTKDEVKNRAYHNIKNQKKRLQDDIDNGFEASLKTKLKFQSDVRVGYRYQVVNMQNSQTIEVRSFKGNLKYEGFMKNIEFVHSMFYFCKSSSLQDLNVKSYIDFVQRDSKVYKNLIDYFNKNKLQLKSIIENPNQIL